MKTSSFSDERGVITDLMVTPEYSITHITFKTGAVRGNHYHKKTRQTDVVLKGRLLCKVMVNGVPNTIILKQGDSISFEAGEAHAYKAAESSEIISMCFGVRRGTNYEKDVFRLKTPLI
jgi:quercetin dioxygenase-like cupin family protein